VDGTEGTSFFIRKGSVDYAHVSPNHGYLFVIKGLPPGVKPSYDVSLSGRHGRTYLSDGKIQAGFAPNGSPAEWQDLDTGIEADSCCSRFVKAATVETFRLYYSHEGTVYETHTINEGASWSAPVTVATGTSPAFDETHASPRFVYWQDGTDIKGIVYDAQDNVVIDIFTALSDADADTGVAVKESVGANGAWRMGLIYATGGELTYKRSLNGVTDWS
jgi:hypothetical protein